MGNGVVRTGSMTVLQETPHGTLVRDQDGNTLLLPPPPAPSPAGGTYMMAPRSSPVPTAAHDRGMLSSPDLAVLAARQPARAAFPGGTPEATRRGEFLRGLVGDSVTHNALRPGAALQGTIDATALAATPSAGWTPEQTAEYRSRQVVTQPRMAVMPAEMAQRMLLDYGMEKPAKKTSGEKKGK